jgi:signal transduction histidine kinase
MRQRDRDHLQRYARAVTVAQENERKRIARDLHDGPAQSLVVLSRGLGRLAQAGGDAPAGGEAARQLQDVARHTLRSIRRTTWALRPALLDDLGLLPAIESLAEHHYEPGTAAVAVGVVGESRRLDRDVELAAFRIVQEALANVSRHASAENAAVTIAFLDDRVALTVADDGIGFDVAAQERHDHFGLTGMRERTELVGGTLSVESDAGVGTVVHFEAPG